MSQPMRRDHKELLDGLVAGKLPRTLSRNSVIELLGDIGQVQAHGNDEFVFAVGSRRCFFKCPGGHNLELEEIAKRHMGVAINSA